MFGLIKSTIRIGILISMYAIAIPYVLEWIPQIVEFFTVTGVPPIVMTVVMCTISTLNWIFTPAIVKIGITIWLLIPPIKLTIYFMHKVSQM